MGEYRSDKAAEMHGRISNPLHAMPELSPFYAAVHRPLSLEEAMHWAVYSDWAMLPHVRYFQGVPDLFIQLLDGESLHRTASQMKAFNEEELLLAVDNWRCVAHRLWSAVH